MVVLLLVVLAANVITGLLSGEEHGPDGLFLPLIAAPGEEGLSPYFLESKRPLSVLSAHPLIKGRGGEESALGTLVLYFVNVPRTAI